MKLPQQGQLFLHQSSSGVLRLLAWHRFAQWQHIALRVVAVTGKKPGMIQKTELSALIQQGLEAQKP